MTWVLEQSDNFNRTDENPATGWTPNVGSSVRVVSNALTPASGDAMAAVYSTALSSEDMAVAVDATTAGDFEIRLREAATPPFTNTARRVRLAGTSLFMLGGYVGEVANISTGVFRAEVIGDGVEVFVNGSSVYTNASSWAGLTGSYAGVAFSGGGSTSVDDFEAYVWDTGGAAPAPYWGINGA